MQDLSWYNEEVKKFIQNNLYADVNQLILNPPLFLKEHVKLVVDQILSRRKLNKKLPNWFNNYELLMPAPLSIEQASSHETATYKKLLIDKGQTYIDLTGGLGVDCLYLSERFKEAKYVEKQSSLCEAFSYNCRVLGRDIEVINQTTSQFIALNQSIRPTYFIDPARRNEGKRVFLLEDCSPNILDVLQQISNNFSKILIKLSPLIDLKEIIKKILFIDEIHVVSVKNDCKELLLLINDTSLSQPKIFCTNLLSGQEKYSFYLSDEEPAQVSYSYSKKYLYDPNSSILKSGAFKKIATDFELLKIAPNTHLYVSDDIIQEFPGRIFKIIHPNIKMKSIDKYLLNGHINILFKNYPSPIAEFKKKWKLKDGGNLFLLGFRDAKQKPLLQVAQLVG